MIRLFSQLKWFVGLVLLQVLILNQMHINGYATPFLYICFILRFHSRVSRNELMLWAFSLGLIVDMFSNTPGMNAASAVCLAFFRNSLLRMVTLRDMDEDFEPSIHTLGFLAFFRYSLLACGLFCTLFLMIDTFSFFNPPVLLLKIVTSLITTMVCVMCADAIGRKKP
ncbi:MAG: rod shape-determining protein MreD [Bacteroides sp.]|nr:rod shape-determining protein MreD [Bacteroides sp.]